MTVHVLTGSKAEIARQVADLDGNVREVIVFVEEPAVPTPRGGSQTVEDLFEGMTPYMVNVGDVDYSRAGIYSRKSGE